MANGTMHLARPQINNKILEQFKSGFIKWKQNKQKLVSASLQNGR